MFAACLTAAAQASENRKFKDDLEVPRISVEDAKKAYDAKSVLIIDARSAEVYKQEHIKGAMSLPLGSDNQFDSVPKGKKIIVYCS
jgi:rhodanese-related sulfurtransferase